MQIKCTLGSSQFTWVFQETSFFCKISYFSELAKIILMALLSTFLYQHLWIFFVNILSKYFTRFNFTLTALLLGFFSPNFANMLIQNRNSLTLPMLWNPKFQRGYVTCHSLPTSFLHLIIYWLWFFFFFPMCNIKTLQKLVVDQQLLSCSTGL